MEREQCRSFAPETSTPSRAPFVLLPLSFGACPRRFWRIRFTKASGSRTSPAKAARDWQLRASRIRFGMAGSVVLGANGTRLSRLALRSLGHGPEQFVAVFAFRRGGDACRSLANPSLFRDRG